MPKPLKQEPPRWNEAYTVVFLIDQVPPRRIVLLKRASWKAFAPGLFTGIGGAIETGENALEAAHRELAEEIGLTGLTLHEFARCIIHEQQKILHYYWAHYCGPGLPTCTEGQLEWSAVDPLVDKPWIPTTAAVIQEWTCRNFALTQPWTLYASPLAGDETWLHRRIDRIKEGLHFE